MQRELGNTWGIALSLGNLADIACQQRDFPKAQSLYRESLELERDMGDKRGIAWALEGIAGVDCLQEKEERAAKLWGAAESLREQIGAPLPVSDQTKHDKAVAEARSLLGDLAFSNAWQQGRAMDTDQAIHYALAET
jgi:non-specific serine/threonine protein kinase